MLLVGDNLRLQAVCDALQRFLIFYSRWDDRLVLYIEAEAKAERIKDFMNAGRQAYYIG